VQIVAYCPECKSRYQLHDELSGRRMRCPNSACRTVFTVVAAAESTTGAIEPASDGPAQVMDWRDAPPPVQRFNGSTESQSSRHRDRRRDKYPVAKPAPIIPEAPFDSGPAVAPASFEVVSDAPSHRRRGLGPVIVLLGAIFGIAGFGSWVIYNKIARSEETLRTEAERDYQNGSFRAAAKKYDELSQKYAKSGRTPDYVFLAALSSVRDAASRTPPEPLPALDLANDFVKKYARDPLLKERRDDLSTALALIANEWIAQAESAAASETELERAPALLERSRSAVNLVDRFPSSGADPAALAARMDAVSAALTAARDRKQHIAQIVELLRLENPDLGGARSLIGRHRLDRDPAVLNAMADAERRVAEIKYELLNRAAQPTAPGETHASILLDATQGGTVPGPPEFVLASARGLLYALDSRSGRRLWVTRVGLDAEGLPIRIPAHGDEPELVLVASADPPSLTARELQSGSVRWHQPLEAPLLCRPILARGRLLAPTAGASGFVYDFNPRDGLLRGRFAVGQPLAAGGAFDAATERLYVPTYGQYVYVFNYAPATEVAGPAGAAAPRCEGLMPTGHAPGALRGEPIVISGDGSVDVPRYLVLGETDGIDAMRLRAFRLLEKPTAVGPTAEVRLAGWSWFAPFHDAEKLVLATDAGALGLIGIQQRDNTDAPLFSLLGQDAPPIAPSRSPARAELVHAEEHGFWALAAGRLQHFRLGLDRRTGPKLTPAWNSALALGSPLHASQVSRDRSTLFLVTQTDSPAGHWATAVDARTGRELWRRSLGLTNQGDPIEMGGKLLALDTTGTLYQFDPALPAEGAWTAGGERIFGPVRNLVGEPQLLRSADNRTVMVVACRADGSNWQLIVEQFGQAGSILNATVAIPAPLAGTAAASATALVVPLADGSLARVPLTGESRRNIGPNWRGLSAKLDAHCQVVHWRGDDFLIADGTRRLVRLTWPEGDKFQLDTAQAIELPARLTEYLNYWPESAAKAIVADSLGNVHLIRGDVPKIARSWSVVGNGESITAGPWVGGGRGYVVVSRKRLVAIDPDREAPAWVYNSSGDGITVSPASIGGRLVVADQAGVFVALDPASGQPAGPAFRHPAEVASTSAPVAFGPGRLVAILTDGSALVLPLSQLAAGQ
jgi:outer membrane protein assembly factor BamB